MSSKSSDEKIISKLLNNIKKKRNLRSSKSESTKKSSDIDLHQRNSGDLLVKDQGILRASHSSPLVLSKKKSSPLQVSSPSSSLLSSTQSSDTSKLGNRNNLSVTWDSNESIKSKQSLIKSISNLVFNKEKNFIKKSTNSLAKKRSSITNKIINEDELNKIENLKRNSKHLCESLEQNMKIVIDRRNSELSKLVDQSDKLRISAEQLKFLSKRVKKTQLYMNKKISALIGVFLGICLISAMLITPTYFDPQKNVKPEEIIHTIINLTAKMPINHLDMSKLPQNLNNCTKMRLNESILVFYLIFFAVFLLL